MAEIAGRLCREAGLEVEFHEAEPGRPSVVARHRFGDGPSVCFCSHIDVVPAGDRRLWQHPPFAAVVENGVMHGRGTADAKGPVAAGIEAAAALIESGAVTTGALELALVVDEETMGFKGAGHLVKEGVVSPDYAIVGEPTSLKVVRAQRGAHWMRITTRGRAAHGSAPERGVNAILHMAEIIVHLEETLPDIRHPLLGGATLNVGTISGGEKTNIVPAWCQVEVDRRTVPGETPESVEDSIRAAIRLAQQRYDDLDAHVETPLSCLPFEVPEGSPVVTAGVAAVRTAGASGEIVGFRGASDARFLFEAGADTIVFGPGDIGLAHTARERVSLAEVETAAHAYALALGRLLAMQMPVG